MNAAPPRLTAALSDRYRIERALGAGGMATVYLAADLKHDRKVAIKVLKPELAAVLGAERFVQEIKTTAAMSHPHILPLFDSGEADGFLYYVMPYIEGETIREKLTRETQFGVGEAIRITTEIADALDYAHRHGIIHRDIKPENILLHDGRAMVMDFGIALAVSAAAGGRMTETGLSLGTPHYMSPEQATADKAITGRSDIYSLAGVLYEMLTGEPPHTGASAQQIIMKIVAEPVRPAAERRKSIPPNVSAALEKALEKVPADRFESAKAFGEALSNPTFAATAGAAPRDPVRKRAWSQGWPAKAALVAGGALLGWLARPSPPAPMGPVARLSVPLSEGYLMGDGIDPALAISRDGRTIAYITSNALYKRSLDRDVTERLGGVPSRACCLSFSRDGRWILFSSGGDSLTSAMSVDGGAVVDAARVKSEDLVYGSYRQAIVRRQAGDSSWHTIISSDSSGKEGGIGWPQLLPDGRTVLFTRFGPDMMVNGASVVALDLKTGTRTTVAERATYGRYSNTGHVVYATADGDLEAVAFDLKRRQFSGSPLAVAKGVRVGYWGGAADYAISDGGTLAYVRGSTWALHQIVALDRTGRVVQRIGQPGTFETLSLSPDGRDLVTYVASKTADISRLNLTTGELQRLTFEPTTEDNPVYSPDGRHIAYRKAMAARDQRIYAQSIDGNDEPALLFREHEEFVVPRDWAPDGRTLAVFASPSRLLLVDTRSKQVDTVSVRASREGGKFSPDGRWLAWVSEETGEREVYVASFPGLRGRRQVSVRGGRFPQWSARSGELFFLAGDTVMVSRVATGASFAHTPPQPLFVTAPGVMGLTGFAVSADGQRIYYAAPNLDAAAHEIRVVLNLAGVLMAKAPR